MEGNKVKNWGKKQMVRHRQGKKKEVEQRNNYLNVDKIRSRSEEELSERKNNSSQGENMR